MTVLVKNNITVLAENKTMKFNMQKQYGGPVTESEVIPLTRADLLSSIVYMQLH